MAPHGVAPVLGRVVVIHVVAHLGQQPLAHTEPGGRPRGEAEVVPLVDRQAHQRSTRLEHLRRRPRKAVRVRDVLEDEHREGHVELACVAGGELLRGSAGTARLPACCGGFGHSDRPPPACPRDARTRCRSPDRLAPAPMFNAAAPTGMDWATHRSNQPTARRGGRAAVTDTEIGRSRCDVTPPRTVIRPQAPRPSPLPASGSRARRPLGTNASPTRAQRLRASTSRLAHLNLPFACASPRNSR